MRETSIDKLFVAGEQRTELNGRSQLKRRGSALDYNVMEVEVNPKSQCLIVALLLGYSENTKQ
jgi:hypothetical protein